MTELKQCSSLSSMLRTYMRSWVVIIAIGAGTMNALSTPVTAAPAVGNDNPTLSIHLLAPEISIPGCNFLIL